MVWTSPRSCSASSLEDVSNPGAPGPRRPDLERKIVMQLKRWSVTATIVVSLTAAHQAKAVTITWTGGAGTNAWGTPANWNLNRVPGAGDDVVIPVMSP